MEDRGITRSFLVSVALLFATAAEVRLEIVGQDDGAKETGVFERD